MSPSEPAAPTVAVASKEGTAGLGKTGTIALIAIVAVFAGFRFAALFNDLWMDEIWTIRVTGEIRSPLEIFTRYLQANNHPLSSTWIYALRPAHADWQYRL